MVSTSVLRVLGECVVRPSCHLTLQYVDWLALSQLLPDTAETEWLDRHGADLAWVNSDGTIGRKQGDVSRRAPRLVHRD